MFKLRRSTSFWTEPWFLVVAIVAGQLYGGWWMSFGSPDPVFVPSRMVVASIHDGFEMTITAPGLPLQTGHLIQAAN